MVYWQRDDCPWPFSYIFHGEVGVFSLGLIAMQVQASCQLVPAVNAVRYLRV